jgi:hypothetical protein
MGNFVREYQTMRKVFGQETAVSTLNCEKVKDSCNESKNLRLLCFECIMDNLHKWE